MTATSFFTICKYINISLNSRIKGFKVIHCVVTETIDTPTTESNGNSEGGGGGRLLEVFFRELRVRLVSYQKLTAALFSNSQLFDC